MLSYGTLEPRLLSSHPTLCTTIVSVWFSTEHLSILIACFWLSTDNIIKLYYMYIIRNLYLSYYATVIKMYDMSLQYKNMDNLVGSLMIKKLSNFLIFIFFNEDIHSLEQGIDHMITIGQNNYLHCEKVKFKMKKSIWGFLLWILWVFPTTNSESINIS